ncbi:zinc-dependent peptidase [Hydrogenophaga sp.]|uniref:M90 family metallopeptidase n=1 Tax=Hydrogenophaga sp. TaxID=1904254 RepID=UPI00272F83E0|nr:M90 family metallopeptidase [Hydrogenophaga sp.]MDP2073143.1 zinc-dependent peptidase [Hydrogenophaga sp.]MDP3109083.1 zinc-dependent peptidase [Hydrogenophaga sp.]MDP3348587.1 zinc-dependent peptidase [Hydrogenophaga sp.]
MIDLLQRLLPRSLRQPTPVPDALWQSTLAAHPFLSALDSTEQGRLRLLCTHFLTEKEFHGANGLVLTDAMALAIAAQACLPLLHMHGTSGEAVRDPLKLLDWYGDFVGIVVQPGAVVARRKTTDGAGVVHHYNEVLAGEAMDRGPLMLSWEEVAHASVAAESGSNVVIHEFVHKMDMRGISLGEHPDGAPPLPKGFLGTRGASEARQLWRDTMQTAFDAFREAVAMAERFGAERPWLDDYAAKDPAEFFAVTCEAYFVNRERFAQDFSALVALYDGFFRPAANAQ